MILSVLFWICFVSEIALVIWWFLDDLKLTYSEPNPFIFVCVLYLAVAAIIRFLVKWKLAGSLMVVIPGIPLLLWFVLIALFAASGTKWN